MLKQIADGVRELEKIIWQKRSIIARQAQEIITLRHIVRELESDRKILKNRCWALELQDMSRK